MINEETSAENIDNEEGIIKDAAALSGTLYFSQALFTVRGFIIAHFLGPSLYGIWSIFRSFFGFAPYFGLGTQQAMLREVPLNLGKGNKSKSSAIIQTTLSWNILVTSFVMVLVFIFSFTDFAGKYNFEIRLAGIVFVLNAVNIFLRPKFKSEQKILLLSRYLLFYSILNTIFGLTLLFFFKLSGLLAGMIISQLILFSYLKIKGHLSLKLFIDKKLLLELFGIGFPIMILWSIVFLMTNIDKFIVFIMLGKTNAGYYGLASFISSIAGFISYTASSVLFPRMMFTFGKTEDKKDIEKYYKKPMLVLAGFVPIILGIAYINIEMVIKLLLPQYFPAVAVLHILIAALFFSTIWGLPLNLLIALNKQKKFLFAALILLITGIIFNIVAVKMNYGITGIAWVTAFIFFILSLLANGFALFFLEKKFVSTLKDLSVIYFPFIYFFIVTFIIMSFSFFENAADNIIKSLLFIVLCLPQIFYIEKKSRILKKTFSSFRKD